MVYEFPSSSSPRRWQSHDKHVGALLKGALCSPEELSGAAGSLQRGSAVEGVGPWFEEVVLQCCVGIILPLPPPSLPNSRESSWPFLEEKHKMIKCAPMARAAQWEEKEMGSRRGCEGGLKERVVAGWWEPSEPAGACMVLVILNIVDFQILKICFLRNRHSTTLLI